MLNSAAYPSWTGFLIRIQPFAGKYRAILFTRQQWLSTRSVRTPVEGWGSRLLALQGEDGQWAGGACFPARSFNWRNENQGQPWTSTLPTLQLLHDFGVDPRSDRVRRAVMLVRDRCRWEHAERPFFSGEVEPCINGRTVMLGAYFDRDVDDLVNRLLGEQLEDGGWNCEVENGSIPHQFSEQYLVGLFVVMGTTGLRQSCLAQPLPNLLTGDSSRRFHLTEFSFGQTCSNRPSPGSLVTRRTRGRLSDCLRLVDRRGPWYTVPQCAYFNFGCGRTFQRYPLTP